MNWITTSGSAVLMVIVSAVGMYAALILLTRLFGLRSFSKMSGFDFAVTVSIGSILAGTVLTPSPPLLQALVALATLYALQIGLAAWRARSSTVADVVDNQPVLLMAGRTILHDNLRRVNVSEADLRAKLREANVLSLDSVHAVVFESTGDVSVLHGDADDFDPWLLDGVDDADRIAHPESHSGPS
ncbi:MAG: YetF domain-containing protein [Rhodothermales bacterium]